MRNTYDGTLDRSYDYDSVGRLQYSHSGVEARRHAGLTTAAGVDGPYAHHYYHDVWGNTTQRLGWGGWNAASTTTYTNNRMNNWSYDASGNMISDGGSWQMSYDATGQQVSVSVNGLQSGYDGDRLRVKKTENGATFYSVRSSVLGGQVIAELSTTTGDWHRGYVYTDGGQLLALQQGGTVEWVHQDPVTKSQRLTNTSGQVTAAIEVDPWGGETSRIVDAWRQPQRYTSYIRDNTGTDEAMHRRYNAWWARFEQPVRISGHREQDFRSQREQGF